MKKNLIVAVAAIMSLAATVAVLLSIQSCTANNKNTLKTAGLTAENGTESLVKNYEQNPDVKDPLRIGVPDIDLPPMIMWDGENNPSGFEIDLIAETARRLGVSYEIIPIDPSVTRENLEDEIIDMAWGNMMNTGKQRLFYNMTEPYITIPQVIAVYDGSGIKDIDDIKKISLVAATPAELLWKDKKIDVEAEDISLFRSYGEILERLRNGDTDAVICDSVTALYLRKENGKIIIFDGNVAEVKYSAAFRYGEEKMRVAVEKVLKDIFVEGVSSDLSKKWFGENYY